MTCGDWMSERKSASSTDILEHCFKAAVDNAQSPQVHIQASLSFADFNFKLYQEAFQRTQSPEWVESKKLNEARQQEMNDCDALYKKLSKDADSKKQHGDKLKTIARHRNALGKELASDKKERAAVENSVTIYMSSALENFSAVAKGIFCTRFSSRVHARIL